MRRLRTMLVVVAAGLAFSVAACGGSGVPTSAASPSATPGPEHIVSLSPTATEMLFAIGAGKQVVAVDDQSNYPADAPKTDLSGFKPNAEAVAAKSPDLVVLSDDTNKIVDQLKQLSIPVYEAPAATTIDDTYRQITDLGRLTGHASEAANLVNNMKSQLATLTGKAPAHRLKYYFELGESLYSATSKTFIGSLLSTFNLDNVADPADANGKNGGYPQLTSESLIQANPDVIFLADTKCCHQSAQTVAARPAWAGITAVKQGHVYALDDDFASRWGPRVVDLARVIADDLGQIQQ